MEKLENKITLERITEAIEADEYLGFCLSCGAEHCGIEPDAENYECQECGKDAVYGAENVLIMGKYEH